MAAKQGLQMGSFDLACAKVAALPLSSVFLTARELFLGVAETIVASHADFLRGWSRVPTPRTEYEGLWVCSKRGLDKLRASEPCESPVKKRKHK